MGVYDGPAQSGDGPAGTNDSCAKGRRAIARLLPAFDLEAGDGRRERRRGVSSKGGGAGGEPTDAQFERDCEGDGWGTGGWVRDGECLRVAFCSQVRGGAATAGSDLW